ncbi:unnamed protein product [Cochlearia groenlandica]
MFSSSSSSTLVYSLSLFFSLSLLFFLLFLSPQTLFSSSRHNLLSAADELDDLSLFHRATVSASSSNNRRLISLSHTPTPKIAFLFLTNSDLTFLPLWESFFQGHEDLYNAYIHSDPSASVSVSPLRDSSIKAKFIPAKRTARASPSLISAERRLIARAVIDDPNNLYFALISQHCIPLHSFLYIHNHLFSDRNPISTNPSFVEILSGEPFLKNRYDARGEDAMLPEIAFDDFRVGSQFFVMAKRHALVVIKERKLWRKFKLPCVDEDSCYPEEHYFPTLLSMEDPRGCSGFSLTRVDWAGSVDGHPHTYETCEVSPLLIHTLRRRSNSSLDYFFARKFSKEALKPLMEIADAVIFRD